MEWIEEENRPGAGDAAQDFGHYQILGPTFEYKESRTWSYTVGEGWNLLTLANGQGRRYNAMIKAEVAMSK